MYIRDCYACADPEYRLNVRVVSETPWQNLFAHNLFLRPTKEEVQEFKSDWTIIAAPGFMAVPEIDCRG